MGDKNSKQKEPPYKIKGKLPKPAKLKANTLSFFIHT